MSNPNSIVTTASSEPLVRKESTADIDLRADGEDRFRAAVRAAAKSGPMHRQAKR